MRPLAEAAIEAGLIDEETLAQFRRWGMVSKDLAPREDVDVEDAVDSIQSALEAEEQVRLQTTDMDMLKFYMDKRNQRKGQLVLLNLDSGQKATKTIQFAFRPYLEEKASERDSFILPWLSDEVTAMMTNGKSYLRWKDETKNRRIYLVDSEDIFFGDVKMFVVCTGMEYDDD